MYTEKNLPENHWEIEYNGYSGCVSIWPRGDYGNKTIPGFIECFSQSVRLEQNLELVLGRINITSGGKKENYDDLCFTGFPSIYDPNNKRLSEKEKSLLEKIARYADWPEIRDAALPEIISAGEGLYNFFKSDGNCGTGVGIGAIIMGGLAVSLGIVSYFSGSSSPAESISMASGGLAVATIVGPLLIHHIGNDKGKVTELSRQYHSLIPAEA